MLNMTSPLRLQEQVPTLPQPQLDAWKAQVALSGTLRERQEDKAQADWQEALARNRRFEAARYALENLPFCERLHEAAMLVGPIVAHDPSTFESVRLTDRDNLPVVEEPHHHPLNELSRKDFRDQAAGFVLYAALLPSGDFAREQVDALIIMYGEKKAKHLINGMTYRLEWENKHYGRKALSQWLTSKQGKKLGEHFREEKTSVRTYLSQVNGTKLRHINIFDRRRRANQQRKKA